MLIADLTKILDRLIVENQQLVERYDPDKAIEILDRVASNEFYHYVPQALRQLWSAVSHDFGEEGFDAFQKISMIRLIRHFELRAVGKKYSDSIRDRFAFSFRRIGQSIENPAFEKYRSDNDILLKDLAICRQKLFPAGAQVVDQDSGFQRSLIFRGGPYQSLRVLSLLLKTGGHTPFYQIHTHLSELEEFNPEGWDRLYLRLAEMLTLNQEIKGMLAGSWFYDPALEKISPNLVYLRERPQQNRASLFYSQVDVDGGALSKSKTRQDLYKQGLYLPKAHTLVWPRQPLIAWARRFTKDDNRTFRTHTST